MVKLEESTFIITGGASGLGEATARVFVKVLSSVLKKPTTELSARS